MKTNLHRFSISIKKMQLPRWPCSPVSLTHSISIHHIVHNVFHAANMCSVANFLTAILHCNCRLLRYYNITSLIALQKSLMIRKEKAKKNKMKVYMVQIKQDRSPRKRSSHIRLLALVNDVKEEICSLYRKN